MSNRACGDFLADRDLPDYCEGCTRHKGEHAETLDDRIAAAKAWLGSRYLLAKPINQRRHT